MPEVTIAQSYVKCVLKGAILKGYNPEEILRGQGLPQQLLSNEKLRISTLAFSDLSWAVAALLRDETMGQLKNTTPIGQSFVTAKACLVSRSFKESLSTWRDASNWMNSSLSIHTKFDADGGYVALKCDLAEGIDNNYMTECHLLSCHRFHCWLLGDFIPIERVDLSFPKPDYSDEHRFLFYGAPVHYGQKHNALYFSHQQLNIEPCRNREDLYELFKKPLTHIMTQPRQSKSAYIKVRLWMEKQIQNGTGLPQLNEAAAHLGLTEQTLRRRLREDGYTFQKLKEDTRRDMAIYSITQTKHSIEDIGFQLGFSEASTFIRAFKGWTGLTPLAYRKL